MTMFRCAVGHSDDVDTIDAVLGALGVCEKRLEGATPSAGLVFCGIDYDHQEVLRQIRSRYPALELIGCTTDGEVSSDLAFTHESVLVVLFASDVVQFRSGVGRTISTAPDRAGREAVLNAGMDGQTPALVFVVADGLTSSGDAVVAGLQAALTDRVPIVGGMAGDKRRVKGTYQLRGDEVLRDSVAILAAYGPLYSAFGVESGWEPLGKRVMVTDAERNVVRQIDSRPALDFYRHYMGSYTRGDVLPAYPLGVWQDEGRRFHVRSPLFVDEATGTVTFSGEIPTGAEVQMMQVDRPRILEGSKASIEASAGSFQGKKPEMVFVVSCTTRNEMLGTKTEEELESIRSRMPGTPIFGFYAYGEIAPMQPGEAARFHNETCVTAVLGVE
ncbi:MAG: FIST C-terminal domain-containing protein [Deltaproteobacteria bacterium]|nr:FIST C-terminal domain-containing protein [Deltaproteobacteria bacterium]